MKKKLIISLTLIAIMITACGGQPTQTPPQPAAPTQAESQPIVIPTLTVAAPAAELPASGVSFANDVKPIFDASCNDCHGGKQTKAGLDLTTYDSLMAGSFNGAVILAGNSADSLLVQLVADGEMPKRGSKLTPEQIQIINQWVDAGASNN